MENGLSKIFPSAKIITVGSGKGGVGKSIVAAGIACQMSGFNKQAVLIDADLSGANLHLSMGIRYPEKNLNDFLSNTVPSINDILLETPFPNVKLISGASGIYELANPRNFQKQKMVESFLQLETDYMIIDLGAGADKDKTDFYSLSEHGIVVLINEPTSVENAYSFLKNSIIRKLLGLFSKNKAVKEIISKYSNPQKEGFYPIGQIIDKVSKVDPVSEKQARKIIAGFTPRLVVNMVKKSSDLAVAPSFKKIAKNYLGIDITYIGYIAYDTYVEKSIKQIVPLSTFTKSNAVKCLKTITKNILALEKT
jgi:flagellar biosynthesis protein FlhG